MDSSTSSAGPERRPRRRRWPLRLAIAALSLVALVLVLVLGALTYVATPSGGERVRKLVVEKAGDAIAGALTIRELSLRGGHLVLRGVELRDPDGDLVARVAELEVRVRLWALARKRVDVRLVRLDAPELRLEVDESGSNLARAIAARNPTPGPEAPSGKSSLAIVVEDLVIARGRIDVAQRSAGASRDVRLHDLAAQGSARMVGDALGVRLELAASVAAPLEGPLHLSLAASGAGQRKDARVALALGGAKLVAAAHQEDERRASARVESLVVPPDVARALAPSYPLRAVASLSADAERRGDELSLRLDARAARATARVDADVDLATQRSRRTSVEVRHVDLSELTEDGPASDMDLSLAAHGGGTSLDDAAGALELSMPASSMAGESMGPVHLRAQARDGEVEVPELSVHVPGVRLDARGSGRKERLAFGGKLVATDLRAFSRTLGKLFGQQGLSVKGQGRLEVSVSGSAEHPSVEADGSFPVLVRERTRLNDLSVHAHVPDLASPAGVDARLAVKTLALAPGKVFRDVHAQVSGKGPSLALDAAVHGYADLAVQARATLDGDGRGGTLELLSLRYPEASWALDAPVRVASRAGSLIVSPVTLRSGRETISARVSRRGTTLDAAVALRSFDLGRLPRALVDPELALGGILDLDVRASGASARPDVEARVDLQGGRFERYRGVRLHLDASYARDRARGKLAASGVGVRLTGAFDVPLKALARGWRAPVKVDLQVAELRLDDSLRELGVERPITGLVSADVSLSGTADDPRLAAALKARRLRVKELAPADVDVVARSGDRGALEGHVELTLDGKKSAVKLGTPFTLAQLLRNPPTRSVLTSANLLLDADVREVPLKLLSDAGLISRPLDGVLSARGHMTGTATSPRGELSVGGRGLATQGLKPVDATLRLQAGDELRADARVDQGGKTVVQAEARVDPKQLLDRDRLARAPLFLNARLGPLSLSELQAAAQPANLDPAQAPPKLRGTLEGQLAVSGTPGDPRVKAQARVDGLGAKGTPDGAATVNVSYANAKAALDLLLTSQNAGELRAAATAHADLSYPAVTELQRLDTAPVEATLTAKDFDPAFLASVAGAVEKLGGLLYADARVSGTIGSPAVKGRLEWKNGVIFTRGNGDFTDVHLLATGDNDRLAVEDLRARSGKGKLELSAEAVRAGPGFRLHAKANLDKLPVISEGQVAATVTLRSTAEGDASSDRVRIAKLDIPEARVQLPDVQRKDLQKLDDPPDVVLTVRGEPVRGTKKKAADEPSASALASGTGSGTEGAETSAPGRAGMQLSVVVNAPRNLWIQGNDVNTELGLSDGFHVEYATEPKIFGDVSVIRGRLDVFGRRFDLQRDSKISFTGSAMTPDLNVTAVYKNELEQVKVTLAVQGRAEKLELKPTSDPPLPETEIYTLLATGHTSLHGGTGSSSASGEAASLVGSLAASQLKQTLSGKLPLDVLSIEAGNSGGLAGTKLQAGTYVNDRFYVGFTGRLGADPMRGENSNQVDLEYQLSKRWSIDGSYGDARAGDASVNWRKEY